METVSVKSVRHVISATDLDTTQLNQLFNKAADYELNCRKWRKTNLFSKSILATIFYEPSTRTRLSFESSMHELGGQVISTENAKEFSSAAKGETLEDTIRVIGEYADVIVLRHPENGAAERAARVSSVPIINAGDGSNQHPTQAFLDGYTIWQARGSGRLPNRSLRIVCFGDNRHSRATSSLLLLLAKEGVALGMPVEHVSFGGPPGIDLPPQKVLDALAAAGIEYATSGIEPVHGCDIAYITRSQTERHGDIVITPAVFGLEHVRALAPHAIILHPLPRLEEIPTEVDADGRAWYFKEARAGKFIRMGLLDMIIDPKPEPLPEIP